MYTPIDVENILIIAHPDDESMFFLPTLMHLKPRIRIICLTTGNYDGLGAVRRKELERVATEVLEMDPSHLIVLDDETRFPDHPSIRWPIEVVADEIRKAISTMEFDACNTNVRLFTFDEYGISGHCNHRDTFSAVQLHVRQNGSQYRRTEAWALISVRNLLRTYFPIWEWLAGLHIMHTESDDTCFHFHRPSVSWRAMAAHRSQFVWYRRLFVVFSCYTHCNRWKPIT